jgi:xylulokinase
MDEVDYDALDGIAAQAPAGSEGLLFVPHLSGERTPWLDPEARGMFAGLTLRHTRAHMTRAVMEGVILSLKDCLDLMTPLGIRVADIRATGGGARSALWRSIAADVFGMPVRRAATEEGPAFGAALLAGVTAGVYRDVAEATAHIALQPDVDHADPERHDRYAKLHDVYRRLYPATRDAMHRLAEL